LNQHLLRFRRLFQSRQSQRRRLLLRRLRPLLRLLQKRRLPLFRPLKHRLRTWLPSLSNLHPLRRRLQCVASLCLRLAQGRFTRHQSRLHPRRQVLPPLRQPLVEPSNAAVPSSIGARPALQVDRAGPPDKAAATSSAHKGLPDSSLGDRAPSIPHGRLPAADLPAPEAPVLRAAAPVSANAPALAVRRVRADLAHHVPVASEAALVAPRHLQASHRAHNAPARPRAVADASSIPRPKKAR